MREVILDAANELFAARGYEGATLQSIAEVVGIAKPSLLYHFPSKEQLRLAVIERLLSRWNEVLPKILQTATGATRRFDALVAEVAEFFLADPNRARLLLREALDRPEEMRVLMRRELAPWMQIIADYIRQGQQSGRIWEDVDPEAYVLSVVQLLLSSIALSEAHDWMMTDDRGQARDRRQLLERQVAEVLGLCRRALIKPRQEQARQE